MTIAVNIAVLVACAAIVVIAVVLVVAAVYLRLHLARLERHAEAVGGDINELIQESRGAVREIRLAASHAATSMDDVEQITHAARGWAQGANRMVGVVGAMAERPVFFVSKKALTLGGIAIGVLQMLRNSKR